MSGFSLSLLQAVSDWQRGGDAKQNKKRGQKLKEVCTSLPEKYRTCLLVCYRQIALPKGGVWDLIGEDRLPEKISSWTLDIEVAKAFKGGVPPARQGFQGTILYLYPPPGSVLVNLSKLYRDPAFLEAMERNKGNITGYYEGAGRYENSQSEVVLEIDAVTPEDIYSLGGHSSPLEELVAQAADLVYRRPTTEAERQQLFLDATHAGVSAGPSWLNMDATRRVLARTEPQAERLREIKRLQDAAK
ncbi:hypothetical protein [Methylobacillus flagellatus]|uniref:hypothetical protein n=1 Tax=Methylobacillus flagellatus TaxID=405 RepID=UPI0010F967B4|nr:hypothetical protein [Methylobacillus flagellatus]